MEAARLADGWYGLIRVTAGRCRGRRWGGEDLTPLSLARHSGYLGYFGDWGLLGIGSVGILGGGAPLGEFCRVSNGFVSLGWCPIGLGSLFYIVRHGWRAGGTAR